MRYAVVEGLRKDDPAALLMDVLPPVEPNHMRTILEEDVPQFLVDLSRASNRLVEICLRLALLTAARPGEILEAPWREFDDAKEEWRIPAERMKRRREHVVPLSRQALELLAGLRPLTGHRPWLFPHRSDPVKRPMSINTLYRVLERAGWHDRLTPHGLRALFSTMCNDRKFASEDLVDAALAHVQASRSKRLYDRGVRLKPRERLMQRWADHIDWLCASSGRDSYWQ